MPWPLHFPRQPQHHLCPCGSRGTIQIDLTDCIQCSMHPRGGRALSCKATLNDANVNFATVFFDCIGTSEAAWMSQVNAIPETFIQCSAGCTAGTVILRDQTCKGEAICNRLCTRNVGNCCGSSSPQMRLKPKWRSEFVKRWKLKLKRRSEFMNR